MAVSRRTALESGVALGQIRVGITTRGRASIREA